MEIAKVQVSGCRCEVTRLEPIPKGIVGGVVSIEYTDSAWDNLRKTVVFRGAATKDVLNAGKEAVIPAEVVARAGVQLYMGVYGVDADGAVVIPTIWASLGMVRGAAAPSGDCSTDPSLPVWAQIQGMIGSLDELDTTAKSSLVAAVNEAFVSGGGSVSPGAVQKIVDDYLKANPPAAGKDGADVITPTIGSNGNWYLGSVDTGKPSRGAQGAAGVTPDIQIGTVTTLPAGSNATASVSGTAENPLLNLGIPKGADGQGGGSGGGASGGDWELISSVEVTEEGITSIIFSQDSDGNPLSLTDAYIASPESEGSLGGATAAVSSLRSNFLINDTIASYTLGNLTTSKRYFNALVCSIGGRLYFGAGNFDSTSNRPFARSITPLAAYTDGVPKNDTAINKLEIRLINTGGSYFAVGYKLDLYGRRKA